MDTMAMGLEESLQHHIFMDEMHIIIRDGISTCFLSYYWVGHRPLRVFLLKLYDISIQKHESAANTSWDNGASEGHY